ncbi:MAG: DNA gyrase subunit A [Candidatus Saganbacteria bacterium]|uniref:DNA gyrase subunit A n=1 Tax=Candidatus Saganbacteria bacterium TaxID=2575572 RepID=A0A833L1Z5_UNCSA|nr:MAG: DNA gyrase subunit A [Candidatus Saganbacteria bacterium]
MVKKRSASPGSQDPKEVNLHGKIVQTTIEHEMKSSYIDYAMSVIVGRALPDARDGLKPVHRRILFAMDDLGLHPNKAYKKSARVVGETLGKYHPHGDLSVYDAMVRMAQEFSMRYMLVDGQGNFGSVDGDSAAAMRYTEVRLMRMASEMLNDIEKETVNFGPNFDESLQEPLVLPSKFPNLLVNGSSGIAVGMATNIPPQNLSEAIDGIIATIENPEITAEDLIKIVKGPDFPTGGLICGKQAIKDAYLTGRGLITVRARVETEEIRGDKTAIIVKELPYQVNKAELIIAIANLVKEKKIVGISDLRDESDRDGMRIYIELKRDVNSEVVLNQLYKRTNMQTTFGVNMVALVDGVPKLLTLKDLISVFIKHREDVVTRRTKFELKKAEEQAHILEGILICLSNLDAVIKLIRGSKNVDEAREGLQKKFELSQIQAQAILDMKLQKLTQLEREKIEEEHKALQKLIAELKKILSDIKEILKIIVKELNEIKEAYGDKRRTSLVGAAEDISIEELIPEMEVAILFTRDGYIKRMPVSAFRSQLRGGRGVSGMATREEDQIDKMFVSSTHSYILFFTNKGKVHKVKVFELPEASRAGKGSSIANFLQVGEGEKITSAVQVDTFDKKTFLMMATTMGMIKKVAVQDFQNIRKSGINAIKLKETNELDWVEETDGSQEVLLGTQSGLMIRFNEKTVRAMGRTASGVRGIRIGKGDKVVSMGIVKPKGDLLVISDHGFGKRMKMDEFGVQGRGGKGHIAIKLRDNDKVAGMMVIDNDDELLFVTAKGTMSRQAASGISTQGRYAKGVRIQRMDEGDSVVALARVVKKEEINLEAKNEG